jgi:tripartite ATP-independent transporter DctM subunit
MSPTTVGILGTCAMLALLCVRMPIGIAMALSGAVGIAILNSPTAALHSLGSFPFAQAAEHAFSVIPLFVLMGNFATVSGMGRDLYAAAHAWMGHRRGGLASATVLACAGFAALSGSSVASAATMSKVCLPEMRRYNYDPSLATGVIAAGGTLGILIPPSTVMVLYALLTEQSIGRLLLAGWLPGMLLTGLFILTVMIMCWLKPHWGPPAEPLPLRERWRALRGVWPFLVVVISTIGGIYGGIFTVNEAAAVGALLTLAYAVLRRTLGWPELVAALLDTVRTTALVFMILIGANIFAPFLALSRIPTDLSAWLVGYELSVVAVLLILLVFYILLGTALDGFAMMVLTVPIVLPIILAMKIDPIWFGIFMVIVLEMSLISPPVGMTVFVVKGIAQDVPMSKIWDGILPFWGAMIVCVFLIIAFPKIVTIVPETMMGK